MKTIVKCSNCKMVLLEEAGCADFDGSDLTPCPHCNFESESVDVEIG